MEKDIYKISRIMYVTEETTAYLITLLLGGAFFAKLTLSLGFSDSLTALLSSFVNLGCVFQLLAISIFHGGRVKRRVTILYTISQLLFVLLYIIPFFKIAPYIRTGIFIIILLGGYFILNIVSSPKTTWFMSLVPDNKRGRFTAYKEGVSLICGVMFQFCTGSAIDYLDSVGSTSLSFIVCAFSIFTLMAIHTISLIISKEKDMPQSEKSSFFKTTADIIRDKSTRSIIVLGIMWTSSHSISTPFFGTYQIKELGFNLKFVALLSTVYAVARIFASMFLGRYADKNSFAKMLRICYILVSISYIAIALAIPQSGHAMFIIYNIFMAAGMGGINSAEINLVFDHVAPENRKNALAVKHTICGLCGFGATLCATPLLNAIQKYSLNINGVNLYGQQLLSFISFVITIIMIYYLSKKLIKK